MPIDPQGPSVRYEERVLELQVMPGWEYRQLAVETARRRGVPDGVTPTVTGPENDPWGLLPRTWRWEWIAPVLEPSVIRAEDLL